MRIFRCNCKIFPGACPRPP